MTPAKQKVVQAIATAIIIMVGVMGFWALKESRSSVTHSRPPAPLPVVRTHQVQTGPHTITLTGYGTVRALREISLVPQVSGKITRISPALVDGGSFSKGDLLLQIDPQDYEIAVTLAEARLKDAESKFAQVSEEAAVAREEWKELHGQTPPPALVAKEPQLAAARSQLDAAAADLTKARLQLERTRLRAPFSGRVADKQVDIGQYVTIGQKLAVLFATEAVEIIVPMPTEDLAWFDIPGFTASAGSGAAVTVKAQVAGETRSWQGRVLRAEGKVDPQTRMVNVVVGVEQPYATRPPLAVGLFASVVIQGRTLDNAALIPRAALRSDDQVWIVDSEGRLTFRKIQLAHLNVAGAVIRGGLSSGDQVVVSTLKGVSDGMRVRAVSTPR